MDKRKIELCYYLSYKKVIEIDDIAIFFNVSNRTITNDIKAINKFLSRINLDIIVVNNDIVEFYESSETIKIISQNIQYKEYFLNAKERLYLIAYILLINSNYISISNLEDLMFISRSSIVADLDNVKRFFYNHNINIISKKGKGFLLERNDKCNIKTIFDILSAILSYDINAIIRLYNQNNYFCEFKKYDLEKVINLSEKNSGIFITEYSRKFLVSSILMMLTFDNNKITLNNLGDKDVKNRNVNDKLVDYIIYYLNSMYEIQFANNYVELLSIIVNSLNFMKKNYKYYDRFKSQIITMRFLNKVSEEYGIEFYRDENLLVGLSNHLSSIIDNPIYIIDEKYNHREYSVLYPKLQKIIMDNIGIVESFMDRTLNEYEIEFIVIYFIASIERIKNEIHLSVLIVCGSGIGTSLLLKEKIRKIDPNNVVYLGTSVNYKKIIDEDSPDLVLSTIQLSKESNYLPIKSIISNEELTNIYQEIDKIKLTKIMNGLFTKKIIASTDCKKSNLKITDIIDYNSIQILDSVDDWKDAIKIASRPLLDFGYIKDSYVKAMVDNINKNGSYIVISEGVALPHANSKYGVTSTKASLLKLREPIKFFDRDDEIFIFICLATKNNEHLDAFLKIFRGLDDIDIKKELMMANKALEIYKILEKMERL